MKITKIEAQKNNRDRLNIYIDDVFSFGLSLDVFVKYNLKKNQELDNTFIEEILLAEENNKAIHSALKYLSYRQRSIKEVEDQLARKGYEESIIENTKNHLIDKNYLNDYEFAENFIRDKSHLNNYGIEKIKYELFRKGISKSIIAKTLKFDEDDEYNNAMKLANKKIRSYANLDEAQATRKLGGYLQRRGYRYETVWKVIRDLLDEE